MSGTLGGGSGQGVLSEAGMDEVARADIVVQG